MGERVVFRSSPHPDHKGISGVKQMGHIEPRLGLATLGPHFITMIDISINQKSNYAGPSRPLYRVASKKSSHLLKYRDNRPPKGWSKRLGLNLGLINLN